MGKAQKAVILAVDDNPDTLELLRRMLSENYAVTCAGSVTSALEMLEHQAVDLVITDLKMPTHSGIELIRHVRENMPDSEIMVITGYPSVQSAVQAVKLGAVEYLSKPFTAAELSTAVTACLEKLAQRRTCATTTNHQKHGSYGLVGESRAMQQVFGMIKKAAESHATVLINGESGTGKELVARAIHYHGKRKAAPFVPVNCGGIPENLLESELFGHVKGAFTGAAETRAGFFMTADGGTLFLDEIGETSSAMQVKLLRVLQEREVYMVGAYKPCAIDVRIIAATNRDLTAMVMRKLFREDLFFRINVIDITLPPLRSRGNDILLLASHFAARYAAEYERPAPTFEQGVMEAFLAYDWPGNVRELENVVQRLVVMSESPQLTLADLPSRMRFSANSTVYNVQRTLEQVETEHIQRVLEYAQGNKSKAATILGIDRKTLRMKLKKVTSTVD